MVTIVNITNPPTETGENKYALRINRETLLEFTHNREDRLSVLLHKAATAYDVKYHGMIQFGTGHERTFEEGINHIIGALFPKVAE